MKLSSDLFELVKSLSRQEKRYIRMSLSVQKGEKEYLGLFEALKGMEVYDEKLIRSRYAGRPFVRRLPAVKTYLYGRVLHCLCSYDASRSIDARIRGLLREAEALYARALYGQCRKLAQKAAALAERYQRYTFLLESGYWLRRILKTESFAGAGPSEVKHLVEKEKTALDRIENLNEYWGISARMVILLRRQAGARTPGELKQLGAEMRHRLLKKEGYARSAEAKGHYYYIHATYYYTKGNKGEAYRFSEKLARHIEAHPGQILSDPNSYIDTLNNLCLLCTDLGRHEQAFGIIGQIRELPSRYFAHPSEDLNVRVFTRSSELEADLYIAAGNFRMGLPLAEKIEGGLRRYREKIRTEFLLILYSRLAYLYFGAGQYHRSLECLNHILTAEASGLRRDIGLSARIFHMVVHYELGNADILGYLVRNTYHYLYRKARLYRFERTVLEFIRKVLSANPSRDELHRSFLGLSANLTRIIRDPYERKALEYFDFISWLESKISGMPFAVIVRKKSNQ